MELSSSDVPVAPEIIGELIPLWENIFQTPYSSFKEVLSGREIQDNRDVVHIAFLCGRIVGTSHLTVSRRLPCIGGLGEVATVAEFRGMGIGSRLCKQALDDFCSAGGRALFLATNNLAAGKIYRRLGWRKLASANVMVNMVVEESPESFLVDYFRDESPVQIMPYSSADRIPMIPLIVMPHDWQVLDANVGMYSTRYAVQGSCMGLFPRYSALVSIGTGACFAARAENGKTMGLATAKMDSKDTCQIDGFLHQRHLGVWKRLLQSALQWGEGKGVLRFSALLSSEDEEKMALFESLGFRRIGKGREFSLDGMLFESERMELTPA